MRNVFLGLQFSDWKNNYKKLVYVSNSIQVHIVEVQQNIHLIRHFQHLKSDPIFLVDLVSKLQKRCSCYHSQTHTAWQY